MWKGPTSWDLKFKHAIGTPFADDQNGAQMGSWWDSSSGSLLAPHLLINIILSLLEQGLSGVAIPSFKIYCRSASFNDIGPAIWRFEIPYTAI